jgi:polyribonucleotide 5'-hydroxyl-kinase
MIVGPHDSGKSTLSRILSAYATRLDRTPVLVDLDVGLGMLSVPGCIGAVPLDRNCFDIEVIFSLSHSHFSDAMSGQL